MDDIGAVWTLCAVITGAIFAVAALVTGRQRWACLMASFFPMVVATVIWAPMAESSWARVSISGVVGAVFGALLLISVVEMIGHKANAQQPPPPTGDCSNSGTVYGNNSPNCDNTFNNFGPQKLSLTDDIKQQMLTSIPKGKPININIIGSTIDQRIGSEFTNFLAQNGYSVTVTRIGVLAPPPDGPLTWDGASSTLTISPSTPTSQ